jgi:hypothetical protein
MALRFRRTFRVLPGMKVNVTRGGLSASFGIRGLGLTVGPRGVYGNVGVPGTGLSYPPSDRGATARGGAARGHGGGDSRDDEMDAQCAAAWRSRAAWIIGAVAALAGDVVIKSTQPRAGAHRLPRGPCTSACALWSTDAAAAWRSGPSTTSRPATRRPATRSTRPCLRGRGA